MDIEIKLKVFETVEILKVKCTDSNIVLFGKYLRDSLIPEKK